MKPEEMNEVIHHLLESCVCLERIKETELTDHQAFILTLMASNLTKVAEILHTEAQRINAEPA